MDDVRFLASIVFWGSCFVTIDRAAKYRISGASANSERTEHTIQGPTTTCCTQREQQSGALVPLQLFGCNTEKGAQ